MPSVQKVKHWYAESFEEIINFKKNIPSSIKGAFRSVGATTVDASLQNLPLSKKNPDIPASYRSSGSNSLHHRYYVNIPDGDLPPEVIESNEAFVRLMEGIKRRHDPVVTTLGIIASEVMN
ncbi:[Pyruvate dehydrogenase (acetyl-transferring)] kinase isozyme 2 [Entomophthora muscae]|nr:[Pyruvate dehydrogenase (acetyl-transferring)] kinase isozyme 2 [Entomophthora muscae]